MELIITINWLFFLDLGVADIGTYTSYTYIAMWIVSVISSIIGQRWIDKGTLSIVAVRKLFTTTGKYT